MSYGLQIFNSSGTVTFDTTTAAVGCLAEVVRITGGTSQTKTYPAFAGRTIFVLNMDGSDVFSTSIDYALGYPRAVIPAGFTGFNYTYLVFVV